MLDQIFDMTLKEFKHPRSGQCVIAQLFFCGFICKNSKNFVFHGNQCKLQILYD